ncbi:MAG: hypothetical protein QOJ37_3648 [Pseudonocardiales bacterium]|nr:hypothetical protein [Pseudonocardiales bacterium]
MPSGLLCSCTQPVGHVLVQRVFDRLGAALRALSDVVIRSGATPEDVIGAAAQTDAPSAQPSRAPEQHRRHDSPSHPMSLVGGTAHPAAPQLHLAPPEAGVAGTVTLGPTYEGGPGLVPGGVLSLLFDHAMGQGLFVAGH